MNYHKRPNDTNANTKKHALGDVVFVFEKKLYAPLSYLIAQVIQYSGVIHGQYRVELLSPGYEKQRRWWSEKYVFEHLPQLIACWKDNNQPLWRELLNALYDRYPSDRKGEMNFKRLIKMLYLLDWKHCIETGRQATNVAWVYDFYGPYSLVFEEIAGDKLEAFKVERETSEISAELSIYINSIIDFSAPLTYEKFINCIYSTHPILTTAQGEPLDLVGRAKDYIILREKRRKIQQQNECKESEKGSEARVN